MTSVEFLKNAVVKDLAEFIKNAVKDLMATDSGATYRKVLDENFCVYVGWEDGFDKDDETCLHSKSEPTYCICVKVAENIGYWDMDSAYMPWYEDGEVYDTDTSVSPNEDYIRLAGWLLDSYKDMKELLENGKISF